MPNRLYYSPGDFVAPMIATVLVTMTLVPGCAFARLDPERQSGTSVRLKAPRTSWPPWYRFSCLN